MPEEDAEEADVVEIEVGAEEGMVFGCGSDNGFGSSDVVLEESWRRVDDEEISVLFPVKVLTVGGGCSTPVAYSSALIEGVVKEEGAEVGEFGGYSGTE